MVTKVATEEIAAPLAVELETGHDPVDSESRELVAQLCAALEDVLPLLPSEGKDARELLARELDLDPGLDAACALIEVMDQPSGDRPAQELLHRLIAVRLLLLHELRLILEASPLCADRVSTGVCRIDALLELDREIYGEVSTALADPEFSDRRRLPAAHRALSADPEYLTAARVVGPRLEELARAAEACQEGSAVPGLTAEETELLRSTMRQLDEEIELARPRRLCVSVNVLRNIIQDDLAEWKALPPVEDSGQLDVQKFEQRVILRKRFDQDKAAYHALSARVQAEQSAALVAGHTAVSEALRQFQKGLFAAYLELAPALRQFDTSVGLDVPADERTTEQLLRESCAADAIAHEAWLKRMNKDQVLLDALNDMRDPKRRKGLRGRRGPGRRENMRTKILAGIASVLAVACIVVYGTAPVFGPAAAEMSASDFSEIIDLTEAAPVGSMMYAKVSSWEWDEMSEPERLRRVDGLGQLAAERGFETVYVVDNEGEQVAYWSRAKGSKLSVPLHP